MVKKSKKNLKQPGSAWQKLMEKLPTCDEDFKKQLQDIPNSRENRKKLREILEQESGNFSPVNLASLCAGGN